MTINKTSIRNEIKNIRSDFDKFAKKGSVPTEISVIFESLFKVVNILIVVFLEKQVRKNSSNSGLPPSQDFSRQGNRNKKASGSQKKGSRLDNSKDTKQRGDCLSLRVFSVWDVFKDSRGKKP